MIRKLLYACLSLTLVLSSFVFSLATSASAAELIDFPGGNGFHRPAGVSGELHFTVPFGERTRERATPYLGLSLNATNSFQSDYGLNDRYSVTRSLAELRLTNKGLRSARIGGVTMLDDGNASGDVFSVSTLLYVIIVAAVAGGAYMIIHKHKDTTTTTPSFPGTGG
jgi:hypothetical protein